MSSLERTREESLESEEEKNQRMQQRYRTWIFFHHRHRARIFWSYGFIVLCFVAVLVAIVVIAVRGGF